MQKSGYENPLTSTISTMMEAGDQALGQVLFSRHCQSNPPQTH